MFKILTFENQTLYNTLPYYVGDYKEIKNISDEMIVTMLVNKGIGLAANQVGVDIRMFVMGDVNYGFWTIINPQLLNSSIEVSELEEGCLSFPQQKYLVIRPKVIDVLYYDINGKETKTQFTGIWARCFLHELDHLNGLTFDKIGTKI